jgi:spore cortex formation protein SpoVR/YcgB (stage V sporulation)
MSKNLPTALAALAHRAEGHCLLYNNNNNNNNNNNSILDYLGAKLNSLKANYKVIT